MRLNVLISCSCVKFIYYSYYPYLSVVQCLDSYIRILLKLPQKHFRVRNVSGLQIKMANTDLLELYPSVLLRHTAISVISNISEILRPIHIKHAVPLPCRAAKGLECVFPIWFTQCGRVWFTLAMPCSDHAVLLKATTQHGRTSWSEHGMDMAWQVWIRHGRTV